MLGQGKLLRRRRRIAVVGTYQAGKTVFLTSLLNHLQYHDPDKFRLGRRGKGLIRKFRVLPLPVGVAPFPYEAYRDALVHQGTWPEKSSDASYFACSMERSDWPLSDLELHFFDFPGERVADAAIAALDDYGRWSDHMLQYIESQTNYRSLATEYLAAVREGETDEANLVRTYKLALARFILNFRPMVSPSTFLLDGAGGQAHGDTPGTVAAGRFAGLAPDPEAPNAGEFVPLPEPLRRAHPELAKRFAARYRHYRKRVVLPLFDYLRRSHALVVLSDVTTILAGGTGMFNDNVRIVEDLFDVVRARGPLGKLLDTALGLLGRARGGLERVAFVAPKLDLVAPADRDRLGDLLKQMHRHVARDLDVPHEWFTVSAIVSTQPGFDGPQRLIGKLVWEPRTGEPLPPRANEREYGVPELPAHWPDEWPKETVVFPAVHPQWPANRVQAPEQMGMERVFEFVTG